MEHFTMHHPATNATVYPRFNPKRKNQQIHPAIHAATYSETPISHNAQTGAVYTHHHMLITGVSSARSHTPTHTHTHDFLKMITV